MHTIDVRRLLQIAVLLALPVAAGAQPPQPAPPRPAVGVLTMLTVKPGVERADVMKVMPAEVRHTVELYLEGKILQWFGRADGRGVVFVLAGATAEDAKAITDTLPLARAGLATFDYVPLSPLMPLQMLIAEPAGAPKP